MIWVAYIISVGVYLIDLTLYKKLHERKVKVAMLTVFELVLLGVAGAIVQIESAPLSIAAPVYFAIILYVFVWPQFVRGQLLN